MPDIPLDLSDRVALVTGASRGIGAAVARRLDGAGARVVLSGRDAGALQAVASELVNHPVVLEADLAEPDAPLTLLDQSLAAAGALDVLVNNAGVFANEPSGDLTAKAVDRTLAVNVRSPLLLAGHAAAHMAQHGGGSIVNVGSVVGAVGLPWASAYAASKSAIDGLTRALAAEWGAAGVRVNAVRPGITRSSMTDGLLAMPGFEDFYNQNAALGRIGEAVDVAELVAFLASSAAAYITGQAITVDGGWGDTGAVLPPAPVGAAASA